MGYARSDNPCHFSTFCFPSSIDAKSIVILPPEKNLFLDNQWWGDSVLMCCRAYLATKSRSHEAAQRKTL